MSAQIAPSTSLMQGTVAGFFLPIITLFFMSKPTPPVFWDDGAEHDAGESVVFSFVSRHIHETKLTPVIDAKCKSGLWSAFYSTLYSVCGEPCWMMHNLYTELHIILQIIDHTSANPWVWVVVLIEVSNSATAKSWDGDIGCTELRKIQSTEGSHGYSNVPLLDAWYRKSRWSSR